MAKYLAKRLAQSLIAILGITVVVFVILHLTGDPVELMVSPTTSREQMDILRQEMGFNDPLPQQYLRFLKGAVVGDFGTSYYYNEPAMRVVMERVPATLELAVAALAIAVVLGWASRRVCFRRSSATAYRTVSSVCWPFWASVCLPSGLALCSSWRFRSIWAGCPPAATARAGVR